MNHAVRFATSGLLVALTACGATTPQPAGTVSGLVVSGPSCPVERIASPCPPRPVAGADVVASDDGRTVAETHTDASGHFSLTLGNGSHLITAYNIGGYRSSAHATVVVGASPTVITLTVDSGIR